MSFCSSELQWQPYVSSVCLLQQEIAKLPWHYVEREDAVDYELPCDYSLKSRKYLIGPLESGS